MTASACEGVIRRVGEGKGGFWECGRVGELKAMPHFILLMLREENSSRRESESMALLEKLIRLDSKDCNFHFKDERRAVHFKVAYPQTNTDNNSNEGLLRQLWHHIWAHYFKRIQQEEMRRLYYVRSLFTPDNTSPRKKTLPAALAALVPELTSLLQPAFLAQIIQTFPIDPETALWAKGLYLSLKLLILGPSLHRQAKQKSKIIYSTLKQSRRNRRIIRGKKALLKALQADNECVDEFIEELEEVEKKNGSEIDREIMALEAELERNRGATLDMLDSLDERIALEADNQSKGSFLNFMTTSNQRSMDNTRDLECLQYLIRCLEEKQIAESVAKILSTQRSNGEIMFQIAFQKAINIDPKLIAERELLRLNFLRETSVIQFYRTGVKSPYSYICHNYVGFRELMQNRLAITARLKDKDILQMMKKGACLASIGEIQHEMSQFNTCHHCKFLYPEYLLFTCKFTSDKQAIPRVNLESVSDPNLTEAFQEGPNKSRSSQRFTTRRKNCLTSYAKIHDEYVCGRKYCFSCLKDTYSHESIRENGLCPFCLGVCICTRCLRNEKIARFKNMYSLLGGDLARIQDNSELEQLQARPQEVVHRGRGRPKKYALTHVSLNIAQKKLRRLEQQGQTPSAKLKRRQLYSYWKRNDSGNDTQEENDPKRKKKRGVGRPRLDKNKYAPLL